MSRNRWLEVLLTLRGLVECVDVDGPPGWTVSPKDSNILLLPLSTSKMARRWCLAIDFLASSNETSSGLFELKTMARSRCEGIGGGYRERLILKPRDLLWKWN